MMRTFVLDKKGLAILLALVALLASGVPAQASFNNGGFETGNFSGWNVNFPAFAAVVTSSAKLAEPGTWTAPEGQYYARLRTGAGDGVYTIVSQAFTASAGEFLTLKAYFDTEDYLPFNDRGDILILNATTNALVATIYSKSVASVGNGGSSGWDNVSYTFLASGNYRLEARVSNFGDNTIVSEIGLDDVRLVPEPGSLTLVGIGLAALASYRLRKRRAVTAEAV